MGDSLSSYKEYRPTLEIVQFYSISLSLNSCCLSLSLSVSLSL